jgi:hypothetical protein
MVIDGSYLDSLKFLGKKQIVILKEKVRRESYKVSQSTFKLLLSG